MKTWEQKWALILKVAPGADVKMRSPQSWYINASMEHAHGETCLIGDYGDSTTPRGAIEDHWDKFTDGRPFYRDGKWQVWTGTTWVETKDPRP